MSQASATSSFRLAWKWINQRHSRRWIIFTPVAITVAYLIAGIFIATNYPEWKLTDTFSMVAGVLFFVIGTALAVAHEVRQDQEQEILSDQRKILYNQENLLRAVRHDITQVPAIILDGLRNLPAQLPPPERHPAHKEELLKSVHAAEPSESDSEIPHEQAHLGSDDLERFAMDRAIEAGADEQAVRNLFQRCAIFALGTPAGDTSVPGRGTESDLLHFTVDDKEGNQQVLLPVYTRPEIMRASLIRNPDWQTLSVLQLDGADLMEHVDDDVTVVINPWSPLEFHLTKREALVRTD